MKDRSDKDVAGVFLGTDCAGIANGKSGTGGMDWFEHACGDFGAKSIEVLVVWPDCGRNEFELCVDIAVSEVREQWRRLLLRLGIELSIS
jgi:hypothetical protein